MKIMGYDIYVNEVSSIVIEANMKQIVATINPHSYITAKGDKKFEKALRASDVLLPDGSGIVLAAKYINKENIKKIAGADLHQHLLNQLNDINGKCFYLGASQKTLDEIHKRVSREYPNIIFDSYSPPFKAEFSKEENRTITTRVNAYKPDVLFVGMTAPKQEKWLVENKEELNFHIAAPIGAVFDFYAGSVERSSQFWIDNHLEWLPRLLKEPKRLWKRSFVSTPLFLIDMFLFKSGLKK